MSKRCLLLLAILLLAAATASAQSVQVAVDAGLISISCKNATISDVFEHIESETGIELIIEDEVKAKRLSANLDGVPIAMAVQRLLEGNGVNYAVMMNPRDWGQVEKIFVGAGGGGPARSAAPPRRAPIPPPEPVDDGYDDFEDMDDLEDFEDMDELDDMDDDELMDDPDGLGENLQDFAPPGSSPVPNYLPPQQSFPRSNFTPGLPNGGPGTAAPGANPAQPPPPATFPFMDPLGRPIPVPPDMQQQQQEQQRRQQQQQQQQQQ